CRLLSRKISCAHLVALEHVRRLRASKRNEIPIAHKHKMFETPMLPVTFDFCPSGSCVSGRRRLSYAEEEGEDGHISCGSHHKPRAPSASGCFAFAGFIFPISASIIENA